MPNAFIKHVSTYFPDKVLTNLDLTQLFSQLSEAEIVKKTGVKKRHIAAENELPSDLCIQAAVNLFEETAFEKDKIDFLLYCTEALDYTAPATSCILHQKLGLRKQVGCLDFNYGCTGYVYGLSLAQALIKSGMARNILFLAGETPSIVLHPEDAELRMLFGDAGTATLICADEKKGMGQFVFGTDGSGVQHLNVNGACMRQPVDEKWLEKYKNASGMKYGRMEMNGTEVFLFTLREVPPMIEQVLAKNEMQFEDIDLFLFHQPNAYLLEALRKKLKIPKDKYFVYLEDTGNTASATIPIAWHEAQRRGVLKEGMTVLMAAFGIGLSWTATIMKT